MLFPYPLDSLMRALIRRKRFSEKTYWIVATVGVAFILLGFLGALVIKHYFHAPQAAHNIVGVMGAIGLLLILIGAELANIQLSVNREARVEIAEQKLQENPDKPKLAWDVAQARLENYLGDNLSQARLIYYLTVLVMIVGFVFIGIGAYVAFYYEKRFNAAVLSAVSGILVSFIGGTFLVLFKTTMAQAKDYVTILERINPVGMSVQILESITKDDLKQESLAEIAKNLLQMYSPQPAKALKKTQKKKESTRQ
jgi:MFS family permease